MSNPILDITELTLRPIKWQTVNRDIQSHPVCNEDEEIAAMMVLIRDALGHRARVQPYIPVDELLLVLHNDCHRKDTENTSNRTKSPSLLGIIDASLATHRAKTPLLEN